MIFSECEFYKVSLDTSSQVATLLWKREVKLPEFQEGCRQLGALILEYNIRRCLIESSNRGALTAEAEEWLNTLPAHAAFQKGYLQVALVMSEKRYQDLIYDYSLESTRYALELPIHFNYFTNIEEALDWLLHDQIASV